jgi:Ca2+-binding EF-hand superfamily protein
LFDTLDVDQNNELAAEEIPDEHRRHFDRLVRTGDKNADGKLTREEFVGALSQEDAPVAAPGNEPSQDQRRRGQFNFADMFARWDADNSGSVTLEELPEQMRDRMRQVFEDAGKDALTLEELQRAGGRRGGQFDGTQFVNMLRRMDSNEDGKLTLSEVPEDQRERMRQMFDRFGTEEIDIAQAGERFAQFANRPGDNPNPRPDGDRPRPPLLQTLDSDNDGRLSKDELAAAADKFSELDRNGDGQLDPPELFGFGGPMRDGDRPENVRGTNRRPDRDNPDSPERPRRPESDTP